MIMRTELLHPLSVHFPIAFIVLFIVIKIATLFVKDEIVKKIGNFFYQASLILSLILTAISLYLGDSAAEVVKGKICQISKIDQHEELAKLLLLVLIVLLAVEILFIFMRDHWKVLNSKTLMVVHSILVLILFAATGIYLFQTAHTGAALVYEQGAGVLNYTKNCP